MNEGDKTNQTNTEDDLPEILKDFARGDSGDFLQKRGEPGYDPRLEKLRTESLQNSVKKLRDRLRV